MCDKLSTKSKLRFTFLLKSVKSHVLKRTYCHVRKKSIMFCWVYLAAYRLIVCALLSLLSGSFCVANCQRGWCEARHLPSKLTWLLTRNYMHLWAAYFTNGFYMTPSKRCINYTKAQICNWKLIRWRKRGKLAKLL